MLLLQIGFDIYVNDDFWKWITNGCTVSYMASKPRNRFTFEIADDELKKLHVYAYENHVTAAKVLRDYIRNLSGKPNSDWRNALKTPG